MLRAERQGTASLRCQPEQIIKNKHMESYIYMRIQSKLTKGSHEVSL